jgi:hypothetical protein
MAESISLEVQGDVPKEVLTKLHSEITPQYIYGLLVQNEMPTDPATVDNVVTSYRMGFPTQDAALKVLETEKGLKYWGIASGSASRPERISIKYLILKHFQNQFTKIGIKSELNIADLNLETVEYMADKDMFDDELPKLQEIAEKRGNLENITLGVYVASR